MVKSVKTVGTERHSGSRRTGDPMSLRWPPALLARIKRYAAAGGLSLPDAVRELTRERLDEIEGQRVLTQAEEWQRAQAWASAQKVLDGTAREVSREELMAGFDEAVKRARERKAAIESARR